MKKLKAVLLGSGDRGNRYADYALNCKGELEIIAVIDPVKVKLSQAKEKFNLSEKDLFTSLDEFLKAGIKCDFVINATMDQLHYETTIKLLENKYNILLEKPIVNNSKELLEIEELMDKNNCKIVVCHVLRYTPFYSTIKNIIDSGKIGEVISMELNEHVWYGHFVNSYVRGKWRNEEECGSSLLLAKCCHDTDLMCWLNNKTEPRYISSFGSKSFFNEKHAPKGASKHCFDCPNKEECMFNAYKFELEKDFIPFYTWNNIKKPLEEITKEEKIEYLKTDVMGSCVFNNDMDIVDRQTVSIEYENGSIGTLNIVGGSSKAGRHIHVTCTMGEIVGYIEENSLVVRYFSKEDISYSEEIINLDTNSKEKDNSVAGHYGGDYYIMKNVCSYFRGDEVTNSLTKISDSINSHLICYAAEKARKEKQIIDLKTEYCR